MKYWWSRVVNAIFISVAECFPAALVYTFLSHGPRGDEYLKVIR